MNNERFAVPELLFHPSDIGKAIHKFLCPVGHRKFKLSYLTGVSFEFLSLRNPDIDD